MTTSTQPGYPDALALTPLDSAPEATIAVPGSKSLTNRALILAALADGRSTLYSALASDDIRVMIDSLQRLGFVVRADSTAETITVEGLGGHIPATEAELFLGNSGTSMRFLTAFVALGNGRFRLDGVERMRQRPQQDLLDALADLGIPARSERGAGYPPLIVVGEGRLRGGTIRMNTEASSQFLSALLMIAPFAQSDLTVEIVGAFRPFYVEITRCMMAQWGVQTSLGKNQPEVSPLDGSRSLACHVPGNQRYTAQSAYEIEPDASSASYFFAAAAVTGGRVTVPGLGPEALQGDVRFATEVLTEMGCKVTHDTQGITVQGPPEGRLHGVDRDMSAISDTSLTLAAIAPFANSPTTIRNIAHARLQECDRIAAACAELTRLGVQVEERADGFTVYPAAHITPAAVQTYHDHRVAMSFALIGLKAPGITIQDPGCVAKTFPDYWRRLEQLRR